MLSSNTIGSSDNSSESQPLSAPLDTGSSNNNNNTNVVAQRPPKLPPIRWWKNINGYWIVLTSLCSWFLFWHAPMVFSQRTSAMDNMFLLHLVGAYSITMACMTNTLTTPSVAGPTWHGWVGRIGNFGGLISFVAGAYCAWWPWRNELPSRGFSIGITVGGIFQVSGQISGYKAIQKYQRLKRGIQQLEAAASSKPGGRRKGGVADNEEEKDEEHETIKRNLIQQRDEALKQHVFNMIGVYAAGCGAPAGIRLLETAGLPNIPALILSVVSLVGLVRFWGERYFRNNDLTNPI